MTKFFVGDPHLGHNGIIRMMARINEQGDLFSCIEEHDDYMIGQINWTVGMHDELYILGDFAWEKPGKYRQRIHCKHVRLILGNHDKRSQCGNVFGDIKDLMTVKVRSGNANDVLKVVLSHYPFAFWDGSHKGWGNLYGHIHGQREEFLERLFPQRRALDVGIDNIYDLYGSYRPISEHEVFDYMARRDGHDDLDYYMKYQSELYKRRGLGHLNPFDKSDRVG